MNSIPIFRFTQLSIGVSRTSIRHGHILPRRRFPRYDLSKNPPGLGEQIWVYDHVLTKQVVYSHTKTLDANRAMKQLPFHSKKSKDTKLRKDYWRPMALIEFPEGCGVAGQSAFQKLREFRRMHELTWGDEMFFTEDEDGRRRTRTRQERGHALRDQRANSIADMAAVLAGAGAGSRLWISVKERALLDEGKSLMGKRWSPAPKKDDAEKALVMATVYWANGLDRNYASSWSDNVTHLSLEEKLAEEESAKAEKREETTAADSVDGEPSVVPA